MASTASVASTKAAWASLGGPAGLGEHRLLAGHVGGEGVEGRLDLGVGGLEGVDLAGDLGLLGPHPLALGRRIAVRAAPSP